MYECFELLDFLTNIGRWANFNVVHLGNCSTETIKGVSKSMLLAEYVHIDRVSNERLLHC